MKSKIHIFSLLIVCAALLAFMIKSDFKNFDFKEKEHKEYKSKEHESEEDESKENEEAELKNKRTVLVSPEKQNQIWDNLNAMHKGKTFQDDKLMMPWYASGPVGIRDMYSPDYLHKYSGRCMMIDFDRNGNFWVGAAHGGLWAGPYILYPIPVSENLNSQKIGAFATHPAHDSDYFVGTGLFHPYYGDPGTGLWRMKGDGSTFTKQNLSEPNVAWFSSIKFHRTNPNIILVASSHGIFRTSNDGANWNKIIVGDTTLEQSQMISDLQLDPSNSDIMYAIRSSLRGRSGVFKSTNAGVNWTRLNIANTNMGNSKIAICKNFPNVVYAYITNNISWVPDAIYRSTNSGGNWSQDMSANTMLGGQTYNNASISVCPNDPSTVLVGGQYMLRTTNAGTTWSLVDADYVHADITSFAWKSNTEVWSTSDGGMFKSLDKGATWTTPDNIMFVSEIFNISISPVFELDQAIGLEHNGVCITHGFGNDYRLTKSGDGSGVAYSPSEKNTVFCIVGFFSSGLPFRWFRSTYGGDYDTWSERSSDITNPCGQWYQSVKADKQSPFNLYTNVCNTVWTSDNEGGGWTNLNCPTSYIIDRMITVNDNGVVFACPSDTGAGPAGKLKVYSGGAWSDRTPPGLGHSQIERVRTAVRNPNTVYALTSGTNSVGKKIFKSTNLGLNWTNISGTGLDDVTMADIVTHPTDPNRVYVGTQGFGFFGTTNGGVNWYPWNNGAQKSVRISEMAYVDSGYVSDHFLIFAATYGRGIYIRDLNDDPSGIGNNSSTVDNYSLRQNYPNPFNPTTTIEFNMKKAGIAKMEVYDITGKIVAVLFDGYKQEGRQITKFNGYSFPSGVYFYRFTTDGFADTKKMMIVK